MTMTSLYSLFAAIETVGLPGALVAIEAVGLLGALGAIAALHRRVRRLEARSSTTVAQVLDVAREAQHMGLSVAARLAEQQRLLDSHAAKPRRARATKAREEPMAPIVPAPLTVRSAVAEHEPSTAEAAVTDQDLARERGMDPLGVAIQRKLVGHAIRTA
jgi:hypothetical protein